ncbi:MAG TPA: cytochrome c [Opitutaceae bacterium]
MRRAIACLLLLASQARALELHADRSSPFDLALSGELSGVPAGSARYVRWSELRALPTTTLTLDGEFVKGPQKVTALFLSDLWKALPAKAGADTLLARCSDGYASVFTSAFIARYRPFVVLEINGEGPASWPPKGLDFNPGPYVITVSEALVPAVAAFRDVEHKKPWGVASLEVATYSRSYQPIYTGRWESLPPAAADGREIWINSCASCHAGPGGTFGGTKANRPFEVIQAYAAYDRSFFVRYVRDPKSLVASAEMEAHPHYTDAELSDLVGFLTAGDFGPEAARGGRPLHDIVRDSLR